MLFSQVRSLRSVTPHRIGRNATIVLAFAAAFGSAGATRGMPISKPDVTVIPSPNFGSRPSTPGIVDSVVMHTTEVSLSGTLDIFRDPARQVSAHFVVAPNGDIYEMVDTSKRAWHATYYNSRSVGIEMVGYAGQRSTWNENNLDALVDLLAWIVTEYPEIPLAHPEGDAYDFVDDRYDYKGIVAHGQVQPWNRTDPGPYFPWDDVLSEVAARIDAVPEPSLLLVLASSCFALSVTPIRRFARKNGRSCDEVS